MQVIKIAKKKENNLKITENEKTKVIYDSVLITLPMIKWIYIFRNMLQLQKNKKFRFD